MQKNKSVSSPTLLLLHLFAELRGLQFHLHVALTAQKYDSSLSDISHPV